jgi:putative hydrolase of the HAD superfamily
MPDIDFVYFDLGNVIVHFDHEIGCQKMADVAGCRPDQVRDAILENDTQVAFETGEIDGPGFYAHFCEATGTSPNYEDLYRASGDIFTLNVSIVPLVARLRARGIPLGVLSNTCISHWEHCTQNYRIVSDLFDVAVLSYESKSMKPDAKIYVDAIEKSGCEPGRIFFVDDRLENVEGAVAAGLDAVQYTSAFQLSEDLRQRGLIE